MTRPECFQQSSWSTGRDLSSISTYPFTNCSHLINKIVKRQLSVPRPHERPRALESYPFVIWTSEFVFYRDAYSFAKKGKELVVLLDISDTPGVPHGFHLKDFDSSEKNVL